MLPENDFSLTEHELRAELARLREDLPKDFLKYLEARDLSICNFSKNLMSFWPIDTDNLVERFLAQ